MSLPKRLPGFDQRSACHRNAKARSLHKPIDKVIDAGGRLGCRHVTDKNTTVSKGSPKQQRGHSRYIHIVKTGISQLENKMTDLRDTASPYVSKPENLKTQMGECEGGRLHMLVLSVEAVHCEASRLPMTGCLENNGVSYTTSCNG